MTTTQRPTIHLQGIGSAYAKPAGELQVGDRTVWNYGYIYTVTAIAQTSPQFVTIEHTNDKTGKTYTRRLKNTRLVGVTA